jgi:endo-1,4-beta-D-glucanase Y
VWRWTRAHLRRPDGLHSWLWDPERGRVVDANSATDADVDIAFALSIASVTFDDRRYAAEARAIVQAIRRESTLAVDGGWVPSAGNWAAPERVTNLSYFAPYAYDYFDRLDGDAGWARAVEIGYDLLDRALATPGQRLPADFFRVDEDGSIRDLPRHSTLPATFSFDGIRIPWRIDLDCRLLARHRACTSDRIARTLHEAYQRHGGLITDYDRDGSPRSSAESLSFYGALLPAFSRFAPGTARTIRSGRLSDDALRELGAARDRYYDANWVWFGFAAADGFIKTRTPSPSRLSQLNEP